MPQIYLSRFSRIAPIVGLILLFFVLPAPTNAQENSEETVSVFQQLFPKPTGRNGYEEIIQAGEFLKQNAAFMAWENAIGPTMTLTQRRKVLADAGVRRALALVRVGLNKELVSPRTDIRPETLFPDFAVLRRVGRLLTCEMYVHLADGRTSVAVGIYEEMLRLSDGVRRDTMLGGLVGAAIDRMGAEMLARHIAQLSVRDCDRLVVLLSNRLAAPNPALAALQVEQHTIAHILESLRTPAAGTDIFDALGYTAEDEDTETRDLRTALADPTIRTQAINEALPLMRAHHTRLAKRLADPTLPPYPTTPPRTLAERFIAMFTVSENGMVRAFTKQRGEYQLLAAHALIRKFRWEHDRLPENIAEINGRGLTTDICTGAPLLYKKTGETTYELSSVGLPNGDSAAPVPFTLPSRRSGS
jgi:hypothetical protein